MNVVTIQDKKKCVELSKQGLTSRKIYTDYYSKIYDTSYNGFRGMLKKWKKKTFSDDEILEKGNLSYGFKTNAATVQVNANGEIVQSWIKSKADDSLLLELIDEVRRNTPHEHIEVIKNDSASRMLEINLCDMHFGIADLDYYKPTLNDILEIITDHEYEEINVIIGQDMIHNDNFQGLTTKGTVIEKVDIRKAWNDCKTFWYNIIDTAVKNSNKTKITYVPGNHDKNITWTFFQMLKERYQDLEIDDRLHARKCMTYGNNFIGLSHGEFKKSKPSDLRSQFSVKFPLEFAQAKVKEIHCSHLHTEWEKDEYGVMCRRLSTGNKDDDWSDYEGFIGANKRFMIFEWSLSKLKSIHYV